MSSPLNLATSGILELVLICNLIKKPFDTFDIRDGALEGTRPVDQSVGAVDGSILVHADKGLGHGRAHLWVHGEAGAVPVNGTAQATKLTVDGRTVLEQEKNFFLGLWTIRKCP